MREPLSAHLEKPERLWDGLGQQSVVFDAQLGELSLSVPWQGEFSMQYDPFRPIQVSKLPKWSTGEVRVDNGCNSIDEQVIEDVSQALDGNFFRSVVPIAHQRVDMARGFRAIEFFHPDDPDHVYSLNGVGIVSVVSDGAYIVSNNPQHLAYIDWLGTRGISRNSVGGTVVLPDGELYFRTDHSIAGKYEADEMERKIANTENAALLIASISETPRVTWSSFDREKRYGIYLSKQPITVSLMELFELSEEHGIDVDLVGCYQHGSTMDELHKEAVHVQPHLQNLFMTASPGALPTFWKDFETLMNLENHDRKIQKDVFRSGVMLTAYEAAKAYDVLFFTRRLFAHFSPDDQQMNRWHRRIASFFLGYFGHNRGGDPRDAIDGLVHCLRKNLPETGDVLQNMKIAVLRLWLAIDRGDGV